MKSEYFVRFGVGSWMNSTGRLCLRAGHVDGMGSVIGGIEMSFRRKVPSQEIDSCFGRFESSTSNMQKIAPQL